MLPLPFLVIPLCLPGMAADPERGITEAIPDKVVDGEIQPSEVEAYYEGSTGGTFLQFKSGNCVLTTLTIAEWKKMHNTYWQTLIKNAKGKHQNRLVKL